MGGHGRTSLSLSLSSVADGLSGVGTGDGNGQAAAAAQKSPDDYRNMFADNPLKARDHVWGVTGAGPAGNQAVANRTLLGKIARHMAHYGASLTASERDGVIPAGYTYLGQLIAHDMVDTTTPFRAFSGGKKTERNMRTERLILDTVYAGGPDVSPHVYALEKYAGQQQFRLRLGRTRIKGAGEPKGPLRDIARATCPFLNDEKRWSGRQTYRTALIADPRNDNNLILSQMLALFSLFHNTVSAEISKNKAAINGDSAVISNAYDVYHFARKIVCGAFRRIIVDDYLSRLVPKAIHAHYKNYAKPGFKFADATDDQRVPVEFTHGAFRFGHSMVRDNYAISDRLTVGDSSRNREISISEAMDVTSSGVLQEQIPLRDNWLIRWSSFFEFPDDSDENRLQTQFASRVMPVVSPVLEGVFRAPSQIEDGLAYRDLVSSIEAGTRSVTSLIANFRQTLPQNLLNELPDAFQASGSGHGLKKQIKKWLNTDDTAFNDNEITRIAKDPPLPLYVLIEASLASDDQSSASQLGALGSLIVCETILSSIAANADYIEGDKDAAAIQKLLFADGPITSMRELIEYVDQNHEYTETTGFREPDLI